MLRDISASISVSLNLIRWLDSVLQSTTSALSGEGVYHPKKKALQCIWITHNLRGQAQVRACIKEESNRQTGAINEATDGLKSDE
jgi:hypothetical protein